MPQALSKCRRPSQVLTSPPPARHGLQDKARMWRSRKRKRKTDKVNSVPVQAPREEDWEQEIEEFSRRMKEKEKEKEKEMRDKTPYDTDEELKVVLCEMSLYRVPRAPSPHQQLYDPSTHHTPPVKWVRHASRFETDQFTDAEE